MLYRELRRKHMDPQLVVSTTILAVVFGITGARLVEVLDHRERYSGIFGGSLLAGGLSFPGGFVLAGGAICAFLWWQKVPILRFCDASSPGLMLAYGIARIGCQLSGDGDYGTPTSLPWGMAYPRGTVPTSEIVHPTPIYETLASGVLLAVLWRLRRRPAEDGRLFFLYLVLSGTERFLVEFIRLNPKLWWGLTQSQLISLALIAAGTAGLLLRTGPKPPANPVRD